ncbi:unnamed protein product [Ectocarpus fasciculatus]
MERGAGSGSANHDEWGSAVASGDVTKLAELVLVWSGSKPEPALLRRLPVQLRLRLPFLHPRLCVMNGVRRWRATTRRS